MLDRPNSSDIPAGPGVYLYTDARERVIYVGKARHLRRRVLSYFRDASQLPSKTAAMMRHAVALQTLSTGTEKEALLLESSLIKRHRPHYNIVLRDDKQYVLFRLSHEHPYPRLEIVRQRRKDKARYFGPFTASGAARQTLKTIHNLFPLRRCADRAMKNRTRPCLYHHMGQCLAPCTESVDKNVYGALVSQVSLFLSGRSKEVVSALRADMFAASETEDFERAAGLRDTIQAVERTLERQSVVLTDTQRGGDMDVLGIAPLASGLGLALLFVREGRLIDGRTFFWEGLTLDDAPELVRLFCGQYYSTAPTVPPRILVPYLPQDDDEVVEDTPSRESVQLCNETNEIVSGGAGDTVMMNDLVGTDGMGKVARTHESIVPSDMVGTDGMGKTNGLNEASRLAETDETIRSIESEASVEILAALESMLAGFRDAPVRVSLPQNTAEAKLLDMASLNAREALPKIHDGMELRLARIFDVAHPIDRIECIDVSHTSGVAARVGMVVFAGGKPDRSAFRAITLDHAIDDDGNGITAGDDVAALAHWMERRLEWGAPWPDLLLIDGGRGQLNGVLRVLEEHGKAPTNGLASVQREGFVYAKPDCYLDCQPDVQPDEWANGHPDIPSADKTNSQANGYPDSQINELLLDHVSAQADTLSEGSPNKLATEHVQQTARQSSDSFDRQINGNIGGIFALAGMAKARDETGKTDRRAGNIADRLFVPRRSNPLNVREGSPELLFLQHIRDTAHAYALGKHRKARAKLALTSELQRLPGVGPATARLLWQHFPHLQAMLDASKEDLAAIEGIGRKRAQLLHERLRSLHVSS